MKLSGICLFGSSDSFAFVFPDPLLLHHPNAAIWKGIQNVQQDHPFLRAGHHRSAARQ